MYRHDQKRRILIVEDDPSSRKALAGCLRPTYDVAVAADGEEALSAALAHPQPDLVVTDVTMPEMGGLELVRRLRADPRTAEIPLVFLTAHGTATDLIAGLRAGGDHYLLKPVDVDLLLSLVEHLLRRT